MPPVPRSSRSSSAPSSGGRPWPGSTTSPQAGVAAEVSIDTNDGEVALHDADNERLGLVAEYPHPTLGQVRQFGTLVDFSETPTGPYGPPPLVGEHTRQIMERVGYSCEEIDDLLARGIIYEPTEDYRWAQ